MRDKTSIADYLHEIAQHIQICTSSDGDVCIGYGDRYVRLNVNQAKALRKAGSALDSLRTAAQAVCDDPRNPDAIAALRSALEGK